MKYGNYSSESITQLKIPSEKCSKDKERKRRVRSKK